MYVDIVLVQLFLIFVLSWWVAQMAGSYWTEVKIVQGWSQLIVYLAVISSAAGFTAVYILLVLLGLLGYEGFMALVPPMEFGLGWAGALWLLAQAILVLPLKGMITVWRRHHFGDPGVAGYTAMDNWLMAWQETANSPGVVRSVIRGVYRLWRWLEHIWVWSKARVAGDRTAVPTTKSGRALTGTGPPPNPEAVPLGRGLPTAKIPKKGSAAALRMKDIATMPPVLDLASGATSTAETLGSGATRLAKGAGSSSSSFDLDADLDGVSILLVVALVIIALGAGVMTTVAIVRHADRKQALDVLATLEE